MSGGRQFSFEELPESRASTMNPPTLTMIYLADGEFDSAVVKGYAYAMTSGLIVTVDGLFLYRQDVRIEPMGWAKYRCTVPYGLKNKVEGEWSWRYDTTGATTTVKCAKEHIASYPHDPGNADPYKGAIGVTKDLDVEGVERVIQNLKIDVSYNHPLGEVTLEYVDALAAITGTTNAYPFLGSQPGELLFLGSTGSDGTNSPAEATYSFAKSKNVNDLTFGDITGIVKDGHHYAWVEFKKETAAGQPAAQPKRVHIERLYDPSDFAAAMGWGG